MAVDTVTPQTSPMHGVLHHIAAVGVLALVTGVVVGGAGGRLFMRVAALIAPDHAQGLRTDAGFIVGEIGIGTVFFVIFIGLAAGLVGAVLYLVTEPWIGWAGRWRGPVFAAVLLVVAARPSDALGTDNRDFVILGEPLPLVLMVVALFLAFGVMLVALVDAADRRRAGHGTSVLPAALLVGMGGPIAVFATITLFVSEDACGCEVPTATTWLVLAVGGLSGLWWFGRLLGRRWWWLDLGGHVLFLVTAAVAARQTSADIGSIL